MLSRACTEKYTSSYLRLELTLQFLWQIMEVLGFRQALPPRADVNGLFVDISWDLTRCIAFTHSSLASSNFVEAAKTIASLSQSFQCILASLYFALIQYVGHSAFGPPRSLQIQVMMMT